MKKKFTLGAASDDPVALANRAIRDMRAAIHTRKRDQANIRQAANLGWLAISSLADVAADKLGRPAPGGASARRQMLLELDKRGRARGGGFLSTFEAARVSLHGECFHADKCQRDELVLALLEDVKQTSRRGMDLLKKRRSAWDGRDGEFRETTPHEEKSMQAKHPMSFQRKKRR